MRCELQSWEVKTGKATGRTAKAVKINSLVDNTKTTIFKIYGKLQDRDSYVTTKKIKNVF